MNMVSTSVAIALATAAIDGISSAANATKEVHMTNPTSENQPHPYLGMWVTGDGHIRQELLPNGRYDEARGNRKNAYQGRYEVKGNHIEYWDDTGFTADGEFAAVRYATAFVRSLWWCPSFLCLSQESSRRASARRKSPFGPKTWAD